MLETDPWVIEFCFELNCVNFIPPMVIYMVNLLNIFGRRVAYINLDVDKRKK